MIERWRLWRLRRGLGRCQILHLSTLTFCGRTAVAGVCLYGQPVRVCAWHVEPLITAEPEFKAFAFLARSTQQAPIGAPEWLTI